MLSRGKHILNSVEEFHSRIEELELDQEDRLITADVEDFFVVGDHWYLARMPASILEPKDRNLSATIERLTLQNSKTLVTRPTVTRVTFDLPEFKEMQKE